MNVPGLSERQIERDIASSGLSLTSEIQVLSCAGAYCMCILLDLVNCLYNIIAIQNSNTAFIYLYARLVQVG